MHQGPQQLLGTAFAFAPDLEPLAIGPGPRRVGLGPIHPEGHESSHLPVRPGARKRTLTRARRHPLEQPVGMLLHLVDKALVASARTPPRDVHRHARRPRFAKAILQRPEPLCPLRHPHPSILPLSAAAAEWVAAAARSSVPNLRSQSHQRGAQGASYPESAFRFFWGVLAREGICQGIEQTTPPPPSTLVAEQLLDAHMSAHHNQPYTVFALEC